MSIQSALVGSVVTTIEMAQNAAGSFEPVAAELTKPAYSSNRRLDDVLKEINARHEYNRLVRMTPAEVAELSREEQLVRIKRIEAFAKARRPVEAAKPMSPKAQERQAKRIAEAAAKKQANAGQGALGPKKGSKK